MCARTRISRAQDTPAHWLALAALAAAAEGGGRWAAPPASAGPPRSGGGPPRRGATVGAVVAAARALTSISGGAALIGRGRSATRASLVARCSPRAMGRDPMADVGRPLIPTASRRSCCRARPLSSVALWRSMVCVQDAMSIGTRAPAAWSARHAGSAIAQFTAAGMRRRRHGRDYNSGAGALRPRATTGRDGGGRCRRRGHGRLLRLPTGCGARREARDRGERHVVHAPAHAPADARGPPDGEDGPLRAPHLVQSPTCSDRAL